VELGIYSGLYYYLSRGSLYMVYSSRPSSLRIGVTPLLGIWISLLFLVIVFSRGIPLRPLVLPLIDYRLVPIVA